FGLGEVVVGGQVDVDSYVIAKSNLAVLSTRVGHKSFKIVRTKSGEQHVELPTQEADAPVLTEAQALELAQLALRIESHYGAPQDLEWAQAGERFFVLQTRPITTLAGAESAVLVTGSSASPGVASGRVHVLRSLADSAKFREGEVLVALMTAPDWVPVMRRAAAVVTERGGVTCHAAIVSRELGIPCIVGAAGAT